MSTTIVDHPLQPGERAPNVVLDAISREGKVALNDFRGSPLLIGLFRGLHCPFCRRHLVTMAQLNPALKEKGVSSLAVVKTPVERARLYFRYHPLPPDLLGASDPEGASHRAFGLPIVEFTENETDWPHKVGMDMVMTMRIDLPGELPEPMNPPAAGDFLEKKDGYEITKADQQIMIAGHLPLIGEFLLDREGVVRWSFTEVEERGQNVFRAPNPEELMSAASQVAH